MPKDKSDDILFDIDMQLYDEFNDKIATMNDHLGDIYSLRDVEEVEKAEKEKEIKLLKEAVRKLQKEVEEYKTLLKRQEELDKEKENLIKQGWLNE
jgi:flagellar motility protein MotE (MotC chaperone)